jgi:hypothetical protein
VKRHIDSELNAAHGCGNTFTVFNIVKNRRKWGMGLWGPDNATINQYRAVKGIDTTQTFYASAILQYSDSGRVWEGCIFRNNIKHRIGDVPCLQKQIRFSERLLILSKKRFKQKNSENNGSQK